jgi:ubiquinol-cytochrome c reductase iron-sulfur subunit
MVKKTNKKSRRSFIHQTSGALGAIAVVSAGWPLVNQMNPSKDVEALSKVEVDLTNLDEGRSTTVMWRGKPLFIKHRTNKEIKEANEVNIDDLPDPQTDKERVKNPKYLVLVGVCTHLGCVPASDKGEYNGWFCPCHGSHYDTSGRIRKGPAPTNLEIPPYEFTNENTIIVG